MLNWTWTLKRWVVMACSVHDGWNAGYGDFDSVYVDAHLMV